MGKVVVALAMVYGCAQFGCDGLETGRSAQAVGAQTIVSLTFDDTLADQAQVAAMAAARGMRVTFFVNSPRLDRAGYMSLADVLAFQAQGHEIAGHTISHADLPTLDLDEAKRQVCDDRVALLADGIAARTFAYPFGDNNALVEAVVAACGYNAARDVGGLVSNGSCAGCPFANTIPPDRLMAVRSPDSIKIETTLDTLEGYVLQAEQHGGGWVPLVFHHVCDGCNSLSVSPATFAAFLDWLAAREASGTIVRTFGEVIGGPLQPGVPGPPPGGGSPGLVLQNPSLEVDANGDQVPDCWQRGGSGTNTATFTLESPGFDGAIAQRIDVTSLTSGARRLVIKQDTGACAPAAYAGHSYIVSAAYKANVAPHFSVYYRDTTGSWVFLAQGPALPASASYVRGSYTTPVYPAGTTGISVGLSILAVGSVTMDAFTLVDTDLTPPSVAFADPADGATVAGIVDVAIDASDAGGLASVELLVDGAPLRVTGPPYTLAWDTTQIADSVVGVAARATDLAGNVAVTPSHLVTIANAPTDTTPPVTTVTCNGAPCTGYYPGPVTVALSATDTQSPVAAIRYTLDGSDPATGAIYTAPFVVANAATLLVSAEDTHGNREPPAATVIAIDPAIPVVTLACNGGACPNEYTNQAIAITLVATTTGPSGIAQIRYTLDGSDPTTGTLYTGAFQIASPATVRFVAQSGAGVPSALGSQLLQIDTIAPTATIASPSDGATVSGIVPIIANVGDNGRLVRVRFYVDGVERAAVTTAPYRFDWNTATVLPGAHRLAIRAEDAAGNVTTSPGVGVVTR